MDEYLVVSKEELEDADALLRGPSIEINPPTKVVQATDSGLVSKKSPPWIKISTTFRERMLGELKGSKLSVFFSIALHIDENSTSFPGIDTIAKETKYSRREVSYAIHELEAMGLLTITEGKRKSNLYTINAGVAYGKDKSPKPLKVQCAENALVHFDAQESCILTRGNMLKNAPEVEPVSRTTKKNQETAQKNLQTATENHAKENQPMIDIDEYKKRIETATFAAMTKDKSDYAHYPEDVRPIVERMETLWYLRAPTRPKKKGGQYAFWIESSRELLDACGEFGAKLLDDLRKDWDKYNDENGGLAPHTVSSPKSLINTAASKASLLRQGNKNSLWQSKPKAGQTVHQSTLDV